MKITDIPGAKEALSSGHGEFCSSAAYLTVKPNRHWRGHENYWFNPSLRSGDLVGFDGRILQVGR